MMAVDLNKEKYQNEKFVSLYKQKDLDLFKSEEIVLKGFLKNVLEDYRREVLFIGCGGRREIFGVLKKFNVKAKIIGIDYSSKLINYAKEIGKKRKIKNVQFICKDVLKAKFNEEQFDAIVLAHGFMDLLLMNQKENLIELLRKWVKREGTVIFNVNKFQSFLREAVVQLIKLQNPFIIKLKDEMGFPMRINPLPVSFYKRIIKKHFRITKVIDSTKIDGRRGFYLICKPYEVPL